MEKNCRDCGETKPIEEFMMIGDSFIGRCRPCYLKHTREGRAKKKAKVDNCVITLPKSRHKHVNEVRVVGTLVGSTYNEFGYKAGGLVNSGFVYSDILLDVKQDTIQVLTENVKIPRKELKQMVEGDCVEAIGEMRLIQKDFVLLAKRLIVHRRDSIIELSPNN